MTCLKNQSKSANLSIIGASITVSVILTTVSLIADGGKLEVDGIDSTGAADPFKAKIKEFQAVPPTI